MVTRLNDLATGHKVVIQQRLHESDLTGDLLQKGGYELLCLMEEFEPERRCGTSIGWSDPRTSLLGRPMQGTTGSAGHQRAIKELTPRWPKAGAKLIEDKANGPAVIQELGHDIWGLIPVTPEGGKVSRARAVSAQIESGNVYLPHPAIAPGWTISLRKR